jgi:hypothetical protein
MGRAVYHLVRQGCRVRVQHGLLAALLGGGRRGRAPAVRGWRQVTGLALDTHATLRASVALSTITGASRTGAVIRASNDEIMASGGCQYPVLPLCNETYNQPPYRQMRQPRQKRPSFWREVGRLPAQRSPHVCRIGSGRAHRRRLQPGFFSAEVAATRPLAVPWMRVSAVRFSVVQVWSELLPGFRGEVFHRCIF